MEGEGVETQAQGGHAEPSNNKDDLALTKGSSGKKRKQREFTSPASDRPARERKSIERFIVAPDKEVKEFKIQKGAGTALKDIPNIVFKLSKRRGGDEVVQALHKVLFGKTAKHAKSNILQFSGYVWRGNEEKEKTKVKERLEKCVKESLFQISDLLDLALSKAWKKEDGVLKVFEFLESPYKTTDELIEVTAAKAKKSKKAKKTPVKGLKKKAVGKTPRKSPKVAKKTSRKKQASDEEDESDAGDFEDDVEEEPEDKSDDNYVKESSSSKKRKRKSPKKESVQESEDEEETPPKKKKPVQESEDEEETSPKKKKKKPTTEVKKGKRKPIQEAKKEKKPKAKDEKVKEPSNKDLQEAICVLLQDADFSKVTFTDVMKQLSQKFNTDLTHKKTHLKALIHEEIHKLVGEGDNEDEDGNNEGEIDDIGDKANGDEQEEREDVSGLKAEDEEEDGDENIAEGGGDDKPDGEDEDEDGNSAEDKADGEDHDAVAEEDAKEDEDHDAVAEEDSTDMA